VDGLTHDLRGAFRALVRRPGFSALAILTLAIGIGLNAVAFTAVNALFLKPNAGARVPEAGWIFKTSRADATGELSLPDLDALASDTRSFAAIAAEGRMPLALTWEGHTEEAWSLLVTRDYFDTLDERPLLGRRFNAASPADSRAVLVSERFWHDRFGNAALSGQTLTLNGVDFGVIGVIGADHRGPGGMFSPDVWVPLDARHAMRLPATLDDAGHDWLVGIARLAPSQSPAAARGELQAFFSGRPGESAATGGTFVLFSDRHPEARALKWLGLVALSAVGIVLLIACFNVAGLLLARSLERSREMAVRRALGAGSARLVRQLLTENVVLAAFAGAAAVVVAFWSGNLLGAFAVPAPIPQHIDMRPDARLLFYVSVLVIIAGVLPGLAPALQALRVSVVPTLKGDSAGGGKPSRARGAFVALQVAGSTMFLAIAVLFGVSFVSTLSTDPGFEREDALVITVDPSLQGFTSGETRGIIDAFVRGLAATRGVVAAGSGDRMSFYVGYPKMVPVSTPGSPCSGRECPVADSYRVAGGYLDALGIPIVAGRALTDDDIKYGGRAVISARLASDLWPGRSAIGQPLRLVDANETLEVVGIAGDIKHRMMHESPARAIYLPITDADYRGGLTIIVRTSVPPAALAGAVRDQWRALDARLPAPVVKTMAQRLELPLWPVRTGTWFFGVCGALAALLATIGLFGAIAYAAAQRTREFGIRAAIGASSRVLRRLVIVDALRLAVPGVAIGLAAAWTIARASGSQLPGISADHAGIYGAVAALQLAVALAACAIPARRAAKSDPLICLRSD
jgi:predicted permease